MLIHVKGKHAEQEGGMLVAVQMQWANRCNGLTDAVE